MAEAVRRAEAILFAAGQPLEASEIAEALPQGVDVPAVLMTLKTTYAQRGVNLVEVAGRWRFQTASDLDYLFVEERHEQKSLSQAALETLAIIAYGQPVTRAEIEAVRGVAVSKGTIDVLMEAGWVKIKGRRKTPGRPVTLGTTDKFLEHFGLESLDVLPGRAELQAEVEALRSQIAQTTGGSSSLQDQLLAAQARVAELEAQTRDDNFTESDLRRQLLAALAAQRAAEAEAGDALSEAEQRAILLATANQALSREQAASAESQRQVEALNQQVAALRSQLGSLQNLLDAASERDTEANVQISALGSQLNVALAQVAAEQRKVAAEQAALAEEQARRLALEEAERKRLEEEAVELQSYRSEFFGRLRVLLGDQDGVRIDGDRFVFSSEVLFQPARANLSAEGRAEIAKVAEILLNVSSEIPQELDWVIRVDGHTDNLPLSGSGAFGGMNFEEKEDMSRFILDVNDEFGTTIALIEHDMGVVMDLSDRVVVMDYGKKIGDGTPDEVRNNQDVIDAYLGVSHD